MSRYKPTEIQKEISEYWQKKEIYKKAKEKGKEKQKFYFLDGPPYTTGTIHLGTAWNKSMKDVVLRYKRMQGYEVWDRAGYDMHGLPIENSVSKNLGLKNKDDIIKYGIAKFIEQCKEHSNKNLDQMNKDFEKLGVWMDFENPYRTASNSYISGVWWLVKKAHEKGMLYEGEKTMTWCPSCGTALAKHELEYKKVKSDSIFVKFKIKGSKNKYLVIWTTTPWTIPFNLGVMVHPEIDYIEADLGNEIWIVARALSGGVIRMIAEKDFVERRILKGKELEGIEYEHPLASDIHFFKELKGQYPKLHTVVLSEQYVDLSSGTGLVHLAPGCGPEDYEVGRENNLPPFNEVNEYGVFNDNMGRFAGLVAIKDDKKFIEALKEAGALVAISPIEHDYAHCWRCHSPVIYRKTTQWFFRIEQIKDKLREDNEAVNWTPDWAGKNWFDSWLSNLKDNTITRQRFWGTPLPIWKCEKCGNIKIIGSYEELLKESGLESIPDLHRPHIDEVKLKCSCGGDMKRIPDVLDVWVDSGSASWNCLDFPQRQDLFEHYFPADFIIEGKDQIRGWFNLLMICSEIAFDVAPFKNVYMHGFVQDAQGRKMSKSQQNYISPDEVVDVYGADVWRYLSIASSNPGLDFNYNFDDLKVKFSNLSILWNLHNLLIENVQLSGFNPYNSSLEDFKGSLSEEERFILSRLNSTIKNATNLMENYEINKAAIEIERLFLDISREYIQYVREKLNSEGDERKLVIKVLFETLFGTIKLFSPFAPFTTEKIFLEMKKELGIKEESIHLFQWPKANEAYCNEKLENDFARMDEIIQTALSLRERAGYGVRWPLKELIVETTDEEFKESLKNLTDLLLSQLNIKELKITTTFEHHKVKLSPNNNNIYASFDKDIAKRIIEEASKLDQKKTFFMLKQGKEVQLRIDGQIFRLSYEQFNIEHSLEDADYQLAEFSKGVILLSTKLNKELMAEGYAREIIRRVQSRRKEASLKKSDSISLQISADKEIIELISNEALKSLIKDRVGASELELKPLEEKEENEKNPSLFNIKGKQVKISFN